ncbi:hypothetical protein MO867_15495 [Microbulbifer sp. OS29]|uniref:SbsA Ig-like domain-containing protein n=1 Tax=Microbulbifer okhotskensis TaxID=2926617 RepID=A0A9X2EQ60_9GAMM|nr:hypothetical protein [Microbulbifer okhotskensis]MCO1335740.1 hypothetical protein [Microbulbifer okhotskensis]
MKAQFLKATLYMAIATSIYGCGGGSSGGESPEEPTDVTPPTISLTPTSGSTIGLDDAVLLEFSEPMQLDDVSLSGSMSQLGELTQVDEDSFRFEADESWTEGLELSLVVNAKDEFGNEMTEVSVSYQINEQAATVVSLLPEGIRLEKNEAITVHFSESMNIESLQLSGILLEDEFEASWSETTVENDTLNITPKVQWVSGQERTVSIDIEALSGLTISQAVHSFTIPLYFENFDAAQIVIGQEDFSSTDTGLSANSIAEHPFGSVAASDEGSLFLPDYGNNRVVVFNSIPASNGAPADRVIGKDSLDSPDLSDPEKALSGPLSVSFDHGKLAINQSIGTLGQSVFIYDDIPANGSAIPSVTLSMDSCQNVGAIYSAVTIANGNIFAASHSMARVVVWDDVPTTADMPPSLLIGQSTFENCLANDINQDGSLSQAAANTLAGPTDIWSDGEKLAIIDTGNNRILLWNELPTGNFDTADIVLGQESFSDSYPNADSATDLDWPVNSQTLNAPDAGIWSNGIQLFITDAGNNRVLIWNQWPETNFAPADFVLGQSDFVSATINDANQNDIEDDGELPSASTLNVPGGITGYKDNLIVTDSGNNRILIFKSR